MSKTPKFINANRRGFMQKSAVIGGAAVAGTAVAAGNTDPVQPAGVEKTDTTDHAGYQLTDRVREYYRKARF